jgi:hypothetical protein
MSLKKILSKDGKMTVSDLQEFQRQYDDRFVAGKGFVGFKKISHTYAHLGKLLGRLASYVHDVQENGKADGEDLREKVIPDLLVYSAWLANQLDVEMDRAYLERMIGNLERLYSDVIPDKELRELRDAARKKTEK